DELQPGDGLPVDVQAVGLDARDVEQLRDQPHHAVDLAQDGGEVRPLLFGRQIGDGLGEQLRVALDGGERRAQLVRGHGEELVFLAVELLQRGDVAHHQHRADHAVALDGGGGDGEVDVLTGDEMPSDGQVVGDGVPAQRARVRQVFGRHEAAVGVAQVEFSEGAVLDGVGARAEAEHGQRRLVDGDDLAGGVV